MFVVRMCWHLRSSVTRWISIIAGNLGRSSKWDVGSIYWRRNYSIGTVSLVIFIKTATTLVSSVFIHKREVTIFTSVANVKIEWWRCSGRSPNCFKTSKSFVIKGIETEKNGIFAGYDTPGPLCMSTMSWTVVNLHISKITLSIIFEMEMEESQIYSFTFCYWSKSPNLKRKIKNQFYYFFGKY